MANGNDSSMGGGPQDQDESAAAAEGLDLDNDAAEVEANVEDEREGGREGTTTSFTRDTTADQSLSNYDNFSADDFSFEARRAGRRDANSAIGDYVARVAGIETVTRRQKQETEDALVAAAIARQEKSRSDALAAARMDRTQFSDSSTYGADWMAAQEVDSFSDFTTQARTGQIGRDKWGAFKAGQNSVLGAAAGNWDNPNMPGSYTDSLGTTRALRQAQDAQDQLGIISSGATPVVHAQSQPIEDQDEDENLDMALDFITDVSLTPRTQEQIELDQLIDEDPTGKISSDEEAWAHEVRRSLRQGNKTMLEDGTIVTEIASAVHDPTASALAKDNQTIREFRNLTDEIDKISIRPGLFGIRFTHHDNKTTRQVQALIEKYESVFMDNLSDMGKRNSKAINAKGFDLSKGIGTFNFIQAMANKLGWAYHPTDVEKQLRALRLKWGLDEEQRDDQDVDLLKRRCNERSGYKWDEESNSCVPISNLNTDYRQYLPD